MGADEYIEQVFLVDELRVQEIQQQTDEMTQAKLDDRLQDIRKGQVPGLKGLLYKAFESEDRDELIELSKIAQVRAEDAVFRKAARAVVTNYSKMGEKRNWHK